MVQTLSGIHSQLLIAGLVNEHIDPWVAVF